MESARICTSPDCTGCSVGGNDSNEPLQLEDIFSPDPCVALGGFTLKGLDVDMLLASDDAAARMQGEQARAFLDSTVYNPMVPRPPYTLNTFGHTHI